MLFSDFFKKTRTEPERVSAASPALPDHLHKAREAAMEVLALLKAPGGSTDAATMLCAAAWLSGTSLYRSFGFRDDSLSVTTTHANEIQTTWQGLMQLLKQYTFQKSDIPVSRLIVAGMSDSDFHTPKMGRLDVQRRLQAQYNRVMKKYGFGYLEGARVGILLCSMLIQQYHAACIVDSETAAGIVAERVLEAARTVPPPLEH